MDAKYLRPIGCRGFACVCCGEEQLPHQEVFVCADCGAVICKNCVNAGEVENHICDDIEEEVE